MSYKLTLTKEDRKAIDWIGDRYSGAPAVYHACSIAAHDAINAGASEESYDWDENGDITYVIPEYLAWGISEAAESDMDGGHSAWPCFAPSLRDKLNSFLDSIV